MYDNVTRLLEFSKQKEKMTISVLFVFIFYFLDIFWWFFFMDGSDRAQQTNSVLRTRLQAQDDREAKLIFSF